MSSQPIAGPDTASPTGTRPYVAILADRRGTEAVDALVPYAILAESGAVDVRLVASSEEPVHLTPGMAFAEPQMTLGQLETQRPQGPDVVVVPAMIVVDDPVRTIWLRAQAARGTRILSICDGALVLAKAGLLDGREATIHWYSQNKVAKSYPKTSWRRDRRWVTDGTITTTAGISASEPASLHLLSELAGEAVMRNTTRRLHLAEPDPRHDGTDFRVGLRQAAQVMLNRLAVWQYENVAVPLSPGFDESALGIVLDAWSRTYRSKAWATCNGRATSRHGLVVTASPDSPKRYARTVTLPGSDAMEMTFKEVREAYGEATARLVAWQFEHPYGAVSAW